MKIALCDDDRAVLEELEGFLLRYGEAHELALDIDLFSAGETFLASSTLHDIVFMDIYLADAMGTEVVKRLPGHTGRQIVFVTFSKDHAIEAFGLGAVHYLLKPLTYEAVSQAMDRCLAYRGKADMTLLEVKTAQGVTPIPMERIVYIEVSNKVCMIHTVKGVHQTYTSLDGLFELLDGALFLRAQRSFVVNMRYIDSFLYDRLVLADGTKVTLSRSSRTELKKQYQHFLFELARRGEP